MTASCVLFRVERNNAGSGTRAPPDYNAGSTSRNGECPGGKRRNAHASLAATIAPCNAAP